MHFSPPVLQAKNALVEATLESGEKAHATDRKAKLKVNFIIVNPIYALMRCPVRC